MQQFSLEKWLENPSRKVVTRRGNPVRIICTDRKHGEDDLPIVFLEENNGGEFLLACRSDGRCDNYDTQYDLFFADEEPESIEIPFGAKDSEFVIDEYYIPEGCEARIEGNKVIIERVQKEDELTEFEKELAEAYEWAKTTEREDFVNEFAPKLLDLARKEIRKEQQEKLGTLEMPIDVTEPYYIKGKQDALKDLPKWKKTKENRSLPGGAVKIDEDGEIIYSDIVWKGEYFIMLQSLKSLPKE